MKNPVVTCPYRLRVDCIDKRHHMDSRDMELLTSIFSGSSGIVEIDGSMYIGFRTYGAIQCAFTSGSPYFRKRMIDPYALHITVSRYHTLKDITMYFSKYGMVHCITCHESTKGKYAFVNFMNRESTLHALKDGGIHVVKGCRVKVRGKVLSAAEPYSPAPYSPARLVM